MSFLLACCAGDNLPTKEQQGTFGSVRTANSRARLGDSRQEGRGWRGQKGDGGKRRDSLVRRKTIRSLNACFDLVGNEGQYGGENLGSIAGHIG